MRELWVLDPQRNSESHNAQARGLRTVCPPQSVLTAFIHPQEEASSMEGNMVRP